MKREDGAEGSALNYEQFRTEFIALFTRTRSHDAMRQAYEEYISSSPYEDVTSATLLYAGFLTVHGDGRDHRRAHSLLHSVLSRTPLTRRQRLSTLMQLIATACHTGDLDSAHEAAATFKACAAQDGDDDVSHGSIVGRVYMNLASMARMERDYDSVLSHYLTAASYLALCPAEVGDGCFLGCSYLYAAYEYARRGDLTLATEYVDHGILTMPSGRCEQDIALVQGYIACQRGDYEDSIVLLTAAEEIAALKPDYSVEVRAAALLCRTYTLMKLPALAKLAFKRAASIACDRQQALCLDEVHDVCIA